MPRQLLHDQDVAQAAQAGAAVLLGDLRPQEAHLAQLLDLLLRKFVFTVQLCDGGGHYFVGKLSGHVLDHDLVFGQKILIGAHADPSKFLFCQFKTRPLWSIRLMKKANRVPALARRSVRRNSPLHRLDSCGPRPLEMWGCSWFCVRRYVKNIGFLHRILINFLRHIPDFRLHFFRSCILMIENSRLGRGG